MGKKTRTGTSRRPILQLSPPGPRGVSREETLGSASEDEQEGSVDVRPLGTLKDAALDMRTPAVKATEGLSLLGAYEDSDEEEENGAHPAPAKVKHHQSTDIDSTLANFMAEIDAITMQPAQSSEEQPTANPPAPTPPRPDPKDHQHATSEQLGAGAEFQYDTQYSLAGVGVEMGDWQEVWDENTGCYYYWNTQTNEVAWQLPHYLADQVQGLQQYADSSAVVVNGNGAAQTASVYSGQHSAVATSASATLKEGKKKEVIDSVVALTSEEEERRGVAASLLAPLIPQEVKEAEEKWRKKTLGLAEEVPEGLLNSEGECARPPASPPAGEVQAHSQGGHRSRTQSPASSEDEEVEEAEEDTMELELVLERKKAELRALEEGDGSAGGSSPCSETSQEGTRGLLLRKTKWKTAFLRAPSPDSSSRGSGKTGRETPEQPDSDSRTSEKPGKEDPKEMDSSVEKTKLKTASTEEEELADLKFQIGELANTLTSKMEFLGINKKAITNFQLLLIQTETRIADWREGALNGNYLRRRLQEAAEHIKHYELNATPKGWSCHWDREHRRYFYVNERTAASQWDFPVEEEGVDEKGSDLKDAASPLPGTRGQGEAKPPAEPPTTQPGPPAYTSPPSMQAGLSSYWSVSQLPQPPLPPDDPPPPSDYPPPPPPPPESPPPPPPPPLSDDGEIEEVEMEDEEGEPPAPGTEEDGTRKPPMPTVVSAIKASESAASPSAPVKGTKRKASNSSHLHKAVTIGSSPILYSQATAAAAPVISAPVYWNMVATAQPVPPAETTPPPVPVPPSQPAPPLAPLSATADSMSGKAAATEKPKKIKKDKMKKSKTKMPSLVKKWQSIQRELDEEEKSSSSDEDRDQLNFKRIEEWKQQQLASGKAGKNANFEALPEDWRERLLKKRKLTHST
ncbi:formin-binding protein 4 isoform X2 [Scleropages formosus]|uniref:formin-binding protein 4 isoform X2 n=1 Tax=Scleropages formosus TaxID=113540 RepID=UPI0008789D13|nr:formin-binding protein 4 isoform X2 [Scleropages formosus]